MSVKVTAYTNILIGFLFMKIIQVSYLQEVTKPCIVEGVTAVILAEPLRV